MTRYAVVERRLIRQNRLRLCPEPPSSLAGRHSLEPRTRFRQWAGEVDGQSEEQPEETARYALPCTS